MGKKKQTKSIARNKKAFFDYHILDKYEAGLVLKGSEIKSIRNGAVRLKDGYVKFRDGEAFLTQVRISQYKQGGEHFNHEPTRDRKLLLHRREINRLEIKTEQRGLSLIPLAIYFKGRLCKVELALGIGRKKYDKRQAIAKAEADRRMKQALKHDR